MAQPCAKTAPEFLQNSGAVFCFPGFLCAFTPNSCTPRVARRALAHQRQQAQLADFPPAASILHRHHIHMPTEHAGDQIRAAPVGHVVERKTGLARQQQNADVPVVFLPMPPHVTSSHYTQFNNFHANQQIE